MEGVMFKAISQVATLPMFYPLAKEAAKGYNNGSFHP
jgi:hypothetical protein